MSFFTLVIISFERFIYLISFVIVHQLLKAFNYKIDVNDTQRSEATILFFRNKQLMILRMTSDNSELTRNI